MGHSPITLEEKERRKLLIEEWKESGLSAAKWCRQRGLRYNQFDHWRRQTPPKTNSFDISSFVEVGSESTLIAGVVIEYQDLRIRLDKNFDTDTLRQCLKTIRGLLR